MLNFKENDFITLNINNSKTHYIINDKNIPGISVSLYFANVICKKEIIEKWIPQVGEECFFYNSNNEFVIDFFNGFDNSKHFISKNKHILKNDFFDNIKEEFNEINIFKHCEPYIGQTIPFNIQNIN